VELFRKNYEAILAVRPGITDLASLKYRDESAILARSENPEQEYITRVLPDKIRLGEEYVRQSSLVVDLVLIFKTILAVIPGRCVDKGLHPETSSKHSEVS
jgi:lipopolysaccharide/colanic/teichoic acid biosynthesis glycosyltransferase